MPQTTAKDTKDFLETNGDDPKRPIDDQKGPKDFLETIGNHPKRPDTTQTGPQCISPLRMLFEKFLFQKSGKILLIKKRIAEDPNRLA